MSLPHAHPQRSHFSRIGCLLRYCELLFPAGEKSLGKNIYSARFKFKMNPATWKKEIAVEELEPSLSSRSKYLGKQFVFLNMKEENVVWYKYRLIDKIHFSLLKSCVLGFL